MIIDHKEIYVFQILIIEVIKIYNNKNRVIAKDRRKTNLYSYLISSKCIFFISESGKNNINPVAKKITIKIV